MPGRLGALRRCVHQHEHKPAELRRLRNHLRSGQLLRPRELHVPARPGCLHVPGWDLRACRRPGELHGLFDGLHRGNGLRLEDVPALVYYGHGLLRSLCGHDDRRGQLHFVWPALPGELQRQRVRPSQLRGRDDVQGRAELLRDGLRRPPLGSAQLWRLQRCLPFQRAVRPRPLREQRLLGQLVPGRPGDPARSGLLQRLLRGPERGFAARAASAASAGPVRAAESLSKNPGPSRRRRRGIRDRNNGSRRCGPRRWCGSG